MNKGWKAKTKKIWQADLMWSGTKKKSRGKKPRKWPVFNAFDLVLQAPPFFLLSAFLSSLAENAYRFSFSIFPKHAKASCSIFTIIMVTMTLFTLFSMLYETNLNVEDLVTQRISVIILAKDGERNTKMLKGHFPRARIAQGNQLQSHDESHYVSLEAIYKEKYVKELEYFMKNGKTMLVMLLEDDVVPVYTNKTLWYHLANNTVPLFSNDLANFDCSKRGLFWKTGSNGNKSLCRISSKETLMEQVQCLRSIPDAIDVSINYCQEKLDIVQKRFLVFVHSGMPSLIGHPNNNFIF